ncbi:MAG: zf-HC2 domain-containing protein, partial [Actinomycetota bacterium]|nr:zf-HC2 domain-containing protein [Actinomycetota bacterium]
MSRTAPDHDRWADDLGAYLLEALPDGERQGFEAHLEACERCREELAELSVAADALPASVEQFSPPPELRDRIMAVVNAEAELLAAAGPGADRP